MPNWSERTLSGLTFLENRLLEDIAILYVNAIEDESVRTEQHFCEWLNSFDNMLNDRHARKIWGYVLCNWNCAIPS